MWPLTIEGVETFGLLLTRSLGFFVAGPLFSQRNLPMQIKVLLGATTAIALFPIVPAPQLPPSDHLLPFLMAVAGEAFIGILLGFAASLPFVGIRLGAGIIGVQMGFGIVNVLDPRGGEQVSIMARLYDIVAITLFLLLSGHHLLLRALGTSLRTVPLGGAAIGPGIAGQLLGMAGSMFVIALAVGGPLIAVLFLTDAAMGFVARTVPQMNVFIVGFPVKIGLGLLGVALTFPFFTRTVDRLICGLEGDLLALLAGM